MNAVCSLLAVLAIAFAGFAGGHFEAGRSAFTWVIPYAAFLLFIVGFCRRIVEWGWVPVPFRIPVTCGQQRSLNWIRSARVDNPSTRWGVVARMASEVFLFRSLFRNNRARMEGQRLIVGDSQFLWIGALAFHWALLVILLRHLRLLLEPVPAFVNAIERVDGFLQIGMPQLYLSDIIIVAALAYLLVRRFRDPSLRFISLFTDYFALFLLLGIAVSGILMRYFVRIDIEGVKQFALGLAVFHPAGPQSLGSVVFHAPRAGLCARRLSSVQQVDAHGWSFFEPDTEPGEQQPRAAAYQSLELPGKDTHLRGVGRRIPRQTAISGNPA